MQQEEDIYGKAKDSMGALVLADSTGRVVGRVGTGFTREQRIEIFKNPKRWLGKIIQVRAMPPVASQIRMPSYNGLADGEVDTI